MANNATTSCLDDIPPYLGIASIELGIEKSSLRLVIFWEGSRVRPSFSHEIESCTNPLDDLV